MIKVIICGLLFLLTPDVECRSDYEYHPKVDGWLKVHKVSTIWKEAFLQCYHEDAVLASPYTEELLNEMKSLINNNSISIFIGTHSRFSPSQFVSIEGIPLDNMPVSHMYQVLNPQNGDCLSTDGYIISVVSCLQRLPYMCYKRQEHDNKMTECGTFDKEYQLDPTSGSCYKVHQDLRAWAEANSLCISEGGYLAIINDKQEALVVKNMIPNIDLDFTWDSKWDPLYIGLRDWNKNGTWISIHGEPLDQLYNVWDEGQPDSSGQECGALTRDGKLDNAWCHLVSYFVCEKDPQNVRYSRGEQYQYND